MHRPFHVREELLGTLRKVKMRSRLASAAWRMTRSCGCAWPSAAFKPLHLGHCWMLQKLYQVGAVAHGQAIDQSAK